MTMVRHALLLTLTVVGTGCFTKPDAPASNDANSDASNDANRVDASPDAFINLCGAGKMPLLPGISFPRRNALAVGDLNHDDIDDLAIFGETVTKEQHIFVYFGSEAHAIDIACADDEIIVSDVRVIGAVRVGPHYPDDSGGMPNMGSSHLRFVALAPNGPGPHHIELRELTYATDQTRSSARVIKVPNNSVGLPNWTDTSTNNSAFILDRSFNSPEQRELLFGGNGKMFTASFAGNGQPNTVAETVTVAPTFAGSFYEVIEQREGGPITTPITIITGTEIRTLSKPSRTTMNINTGLTGGAGDPMGTVWASHEYSQVTDDYPVFGLRVPQYSTNNQPAEPRFQIVLNDGQMNTCSLNVKSTPASGPFLTDGVVAKSFGANGTSFIGVLTTDAGSATPINQLWFSAHYNPQAGALMASTNIEELANNELPLLAVGWFQAKKPTGQQQVLVFYPNKPLRSQCFKPTNGVDGIAPC
jgi:hypothetical protein